MSVETRDILGVRIAALTQEQALRDVLDQMKPGGHLKLAFCNAHTANIAYGDPHLRATLARFMVLADGVGVDMGARLLYGSPFPDNLNGTDFIPSLLKAAEKPVSVMLLGGQPGIAERAAAELRLLASRHEYTVLHHGYFGASDEDDLKQRLRVARPDLLLVAMGNPAQENWIAKNCDDAHCGVACGVGALFDFLAGEVQRAPMFVRRMRLEWLWRLRVEPVRLFRRYVFGNPLFLIRVLKVRAGARQTALPGGRV